ncbi:TPA: DUF1090 domain-containing protein [Citrobacter freundii]|nr:DUF1090 domain-containing protein [Citrobacter freundii]
MKNSKILLASMFMLTPVFSVLAAPQIATGCEAKRQSIEQKLDYARVYNNDHHIAGLEKALSELNANCTDERLRADREADVHKKEQKIEERRQELAEAQANGRTDKIIKKQHKLEEAQAELEEANKMLNK